MAPRLVAPLLRIGVTLVVLLSAPRTLRAEESLSVSFQAPPWCDDSSSLRARLEQRLPDVDFQHESKAQVRFTLTKHGTLVRASLLILLEDGQELSRTLDADDCVSAVEGIAFAAAVALDPGATQPIVVRRLEESAVEKPTESAPTLTPSRIWAVGLEGRVWLGVAPALMGGGGVFAENVSTVSGWFEPGVRASLSYGVRGGFEEPSGTAHFQLFSAGADLCPSQVVTQTFGLQVCGAVTAGALWSQGRDTVDPQKVMRPLVGLGVSLLPSVKFNRQIALNGRLAGVAPLIRDSYQFDDQAFHRVSAVTMEASLGLSWRFR